jgi:hydrogenase maturation protease
MTSAVVDQIANAVLYEGYLLYPYRPSVKNRQRWTFGGLYPPSYSKAQGGMDPCLMQTECLLQADQAGEPSLNVRVRFLQLQVRRVDEGHSPGSAGKVPGRPSVWQEAAEREVEVGESSLAELIARPKAHGFQFPSHREDQPVCGPDGRCKGMVIREQESISGSVEIAAERLAEGLYKVSVRILNTMAFEVSTPSDRDAALLRALVSTHAILRARGGEFVSSIDPPECCREFAAGCRNIGVWPVLVGEPGERDTMLAAPIILYDYPQIAPESPGDLFDATEIDEILTLRILTLTEDEKKAMAGVDDRARALLERTESIAREQLMGLHGTIRGLRPL